MARLAQHARLLYLLALFQLVGGPLVLCAVVLFSSVAMEKQVTLGEKIEWALQSAQTMQSAATEGDHLDVLADDGMPPKPKAPTPSKTKEGKGKLFGLDEWFVTKLWQPTRTRLAVAKRGDGGVVTRANAPPIPPPRVVS